MVETEFDRMLATAKAQGILEEKVEESKRRLDIINGDTAEIRRVGAETQLDVAGLHGQFSMLNRLVMLLLASVIGNLVLNAMQSFF